MLDVALILRIFFLLNPLTTMPLLFTAHERKMNVTSVALRSVGLAFVVALVFVLAGPFLFQVYGISVHSFRAAGGLVVLLLGLSMAREGDEERAQARPDALIALIATPMLTGPATLSFLIIEAADRGMTPVVVNLLAAFAAVCAVFVAAAAAVPRLPMQPIKFVSRLLGLFLIALGFEMLAAGLLGLVGPALRP